MKWQKINIKLQHSLPPETSASKLSKMKGVNSFKAGVGFSMELFYDIRLDNNNTLIKINFYMACFGVSFFVFHSCRELCSHILPLLHCCTNHWCRLRGEKKAAEEDRCYHRIDKLLMILVLCHSWYWCRYRWLGRIQWYWISITSSGKSPKMCHCNMGRKHGLIAEPHSTDVAYHDALHVKAFEMILEELA